MNDRWPGDSHRENTKGSSDSQFKTVHDFLNLIAVFPQRQTKALDDVINWILEQDGDLSELEARSAQLAGNYAPAIQEGNIMLMTLACAGALARAPSLETWTKVNAFKYSSWELDNWLSEAMAAYKEVDSSACNAYIELAKEVFAALECFSLKSKSDRTNDERKRVWSLWIERSDKLEELWWDLRGWRGFMTYEEELPLFRVFYTLNPDEFIHTISRSSNPYLVSAVLIEAGIGPFSPRLLEWKRIIVAAPTAFEDGGEWNGSVLLPLLLVDARNQLLRAVLHHADPNIPPSELDEIKSEITNTAEMIANTLAERPDASAVCPRWTSWLMRQILGQTEEEVADVRSPGFVDNALIDAIGSKLTIRDLPHAIPDDAPLWEAWCYRCVLATYAFSGFISTPEWHSFVNEWNLSPEDWAGDKGYLLREHASLNFTMSKGIPGIAANLLAFPVAQSSSPVEVWIGLWNDTFTLREIVEFGDTDATEDEYRSRLEAGKLMLLLFNIGLAIFDQIAVRSSDIDSPEARSLAKLFEALYSATSEMREIDNTLNLDRWLSIVQHLAVRRLIWEPISDSDNASPNFQVFKASDTPTVSDILTEAKGNVIEIVAILQSLLLNSRNTQKLKGELNSASIDLANVEQSIRHLNQCHPRKYPIDEAQLQNLRALI